MLVILRICFCVNIKESEARQKSDTGLEMELLQKYLFIPLDIFQERQQNESTKDKRDAWLTLFSSDDHSLSGISEDI